MKILCVIVLYKTSLFDSNSFVGCARHAIREDHFKLFVYDNSPEALHSADELKRMDIEYVSDTSNPGVSKAYNTAARYASVNGYEWLLILDQDTAFQDDRYVKECKMMAENGRHALYVPLVRKTNGNPLSPMWMKHHIPKSAISEANRAYPMRNVSVINSGMLINTDAFLQAGGYNEDVPLDLADYQFIERFGKKIDDFYLTDYVLFQPFSNDTCSIDSLKTRFKSYCLSALNYDAGTVARYDILFTMVRRCVSLIRRTGKPVFFWIMLKTVFKR